MFAIISLVPDENIPVIKSLSKLLNINDVIDDDNSKLYPHFSWQVAESYNMDKLVHFLKDFSCNHSTFEICINGIGIFTGILPVIYLPIIKSTELIAIHQEIWKKTEEIRIRAIEYYEGEQWIPHITILQQNTLNNASMVALNKIINLPIKLKMKIDNFALGEVGDYDASVLEVFKFND